MTRPPVAGSRRVRRLAGTEPDACVPLERPMSGVRFKLSVMMFLEFFIWGAWLPLIFGYLPRRWGSATGEQAWILNIASTSPPSSPCSSAPSSPTATSPPRSSSRFSHLVGGLAMLGLLLGPPARRRHGRVVPNYWLFFGLHAGPLALLRADHLDHQLHRLRQPRRTRKGVRPGPPVGHHRLDRRAPGRSSSSSSTGRRCPPSESVGFVDWLGGADPATPSKGEAFRQGDELHVPAPRASPRCCWPRSA